MTNVGLDRLKRFFVQDKAPNPKKSVHGPYLVLLLLFLILPFFLGVKSDGTTTYALGFSLPDSCLSRSWFGTSCPGCGMTRSFIYLCHAHVMESLSVHRLGILIYGYFLLQVIYRLFCLLYPSRRFYPIVVQLQFYLPLTIIVALAVNWLYGAISGAGNGWYTG